VTRVDLDDGYLFALCLVSGVVAFLVEIWAPYPTGALPVLSAWLPPRVGAPNPLVTGIVAFSVLLFCDGYLRTLRAEPE